MSANPSSSASNYPSHSNSKHFNQFKVILPLDLNIHDQRTFQKARKYGILKSSHLTRLSLLKPSGTFPLNPLLPVLKARHLKALQYYTYEEYFNDSSTSLGKLLSHGYSNLRRLCIELERCYQSLNDSKSPTIAKAIHITPTLHELYLKFNSNKRLGPKDVANDKELISLSQGLRRMICLRKLHLEFKDCPKISDYGVSRLTNAFNGLTSLQELSLCISNNSVVTDHALAEVLGSFWKLSNLKSLCVDFTKSYKIGDESLFKLTEALKELFNLVRLSVRVEGCQVGYEAITLLLEEVEGLKELEEWELCLGPKSKTTVICRQSSSAKVNNTERLGDRREKNRNLKLGNILTNLRRLKKVKLAIDDSWMVGNEVFWDLAWALPQTEGLIELSLKFGSRNWSQTVNDINIQMLCGSISQLGETLETLHLDLQWSKVITDSGMASLSESILLLKGIKNLHLDFKEWSKITDKGVSSLANALIHLKSLERLVLKLNGLYRLGDEGVERLSDALRHLHKLSSLDLSLERCSTVTDKVLWKMGSALEKLRSFRELSIDLNGCNELEGTIAREIFERHLGRNNMSKQQNGSSREIHAVLQL